MPVSTLRATWRSTVFVVGTCGVFSLWVLGAPVAWLIRKPVPWRDRILNWWSRIGLFALRVRCTVRGPIPREPCILVANHLSYLDILVLGAVKPLTFVSKAEVARWPLVGWFAYAMGVVFIKREQKRDLPAVAARIGRELAAGSTIVLFPEGTSSPGDTVLPFRASLLAHAAEGGFPVAHATLTYRTPAGCPPAREAVAWWGDTEFGPHAAALLRLPHVEAEVHFGDQLLRDPDRKALAERLWSAVAARLPSAPQPTTAAAP